MSVLFAQRVRAQVLCVVFIFLISNDGRENVLDANGVGGGGVRFGIVNSIRPGQKTRVNRFRNETRQYALKVFANVVGWRRIFHIFNRR